MIHLFVYACNEVHRPNGHSSRQLIRPIWIFGSKALENNKNLSQAQRMFVLFLKEKSIRVSTLPNLASCLLSVASSCNEQ